MQGSPNECSYAHPKRSPLHGSGIMSDGGDLPKVAVESGESARADAENDDKKEEQDSFEIDEIEISDRESEDIDVNHRRIKRISKLETLPNVRIRKSLTEF